MIEPVAVLNDIPGGRAGAIAKVTGSTNAAGDIVTAVMAEPRVAAIVAVEGVTETFGEPTAKLTVAVAVDEPSEAVTVTLAADWFAVGVPLIAPVD